MLIRETRIAETRRKSYPAGNCPNMNETYILGRADEELLLATKALLKKLASASTTKPAELVSIAKMMHVLSVLPRSVPDVHVEISVILPRRRFDEIETMHWWDIAIEDEQISISGGGSFRQPSTGSDTFSTMRWVAIPGECSEMEDYSHLLWMVPDVHSFQDAVAKIDSCLHHCKIEIVDEDNSLLHGSDGEELDEGGG